MDKCVHSEKCGGCNFQGIEYDSQLRQKEQHVRDCLTESGLDPKLLSGIEPCPVQYNYRNKMEYSFGDEVKDGPIQLGLHKKGSFLSISTTDCCQIVPEDFNRILKLTLNFCREKGYQHYNKKSHKGLMRSLILRWGVRTKQLLINIVTTSESEFASDDYSAMLLAHEAEFDNKINGIIRTVNNNISDALNVESVDLLYGDPWYFEEILGLKFKVGAFSFFQTDVPAAERLYRDALSLIPDIDNKCVFDLYCGTGTITQAMALKAATVVGVEIVEDAVESAKVNTAINGLSNCHFICGDVQQVLSTIPVKPDVIVVDPPRSGISPKALSQILSYGVDQIVYISCNPKSLAENLRGARLYGYEVMRMKAYDNFPFTRHVETVVLMSRKD